MLPIDALKMRTASASTGGRSTFTTDQLVPKWLADGSPSTLIVANGTGGDWDLHIREIGNVIDEGVAGAQRYKLTYTGFDYAVASYTEISPVYIGWAYSADGVTWTKGASKLISARALEDPYLVKDGGTYYLYAEDKADNPFRNIRLFTSTDFSTWTDQGDILDIGTAGAWDDKDVSSPTVWKEGAAWKMLFEGRKSGGQQGAVGIATSTDGITWTKDAANPVFHGTGIVGSSPISWALDVVPDDIIIASDGTYVMLYHGNPNGGTFAGKSVTAAAYSSDLYTWSDPLEDAATHFDTIDTYVAQYFVLGSSIKYVYYIENGTGIRCGVDMGYTVLKSNFTGSNGSTTFTDSSLWGHALTAGGAAQVQSNKLELNGTTSYVSAADSNHWYIFARPYTMELFGVVFDANTSAMTLFAQYSVGAGAQEFRFDYRGDLTPDILRILGIDLSNTLFFDDSSAWTPTVGVAYDICIERDISGNLRFYIGGTMLSKTTQTDAFHDVSATLSIGASFGNGTGELYLDGRMSAIRFTNGKALYASDGGYTVPSLPL